MKTYGELVAHQRELMGSVMEIEKVIRQVNHPDNIPDIESGKKTLADLATELDAPAVSNWLTAGGSIALQAQGRAMAQGWDVMTWGQMDKLFRAYCRETTDCDSLGLAPWEMGSDDQLVWGDTVKWIEISWVPGTSEGYYVHIRTIAKETRKDHNPPTKLTALGKFWGVDQATACCEFFTKVFYGLHWLFVPQEAPV